MSISLVSAYHQNELMTQDFLNNLKGKLPKGTEVILVNAGSEPIENSIVTTRVDLPKNYSFSHSFNAGLKETRDGYVCIINNDAFPQEKDWLERLIERAEETGAWITAPINDKTVLTNYNIKPDNTTDFFPAVCWLISKKCLDRVGLFDERFLVGNWEDNDYCKRVSILGGKIIVCKDIVIKHLESQTVNLFDNQKIMQDNYQKYMKKWM